MGFIKFLSKTLNQIPNRILYLCETFILWSSGVSIEIIRKCEDNSKTKFISIGLVIIFTGVMAAVTAAMTLSHAYPEPEQSKFVLFGGILWGIGIFIIDRLAVSSMHIDDKFSVKILSAIPRIILATAIAYVIVIPLKLELFKEEIEKEIAEIVKEENIVIEQGNFKDQRVQIQGSSDSIQKIIDLRNIEIERLRTTPIGETNQIRLGIISEKLDGIKNQIKVDQLQYDKELKERQEFWRLHKLKENEIESNNTEIKELKKTKVNLGCDDTNELDKSEKKECQSLDGKIVKLDQLKKSSQTESNKYKSQWSPLHTSSEKVILPRLKNLKLESKSKEKEREDCLLNSEAQINDRISDILEEIEFLRSEKKTNSQKQNDLDVSDKDYKATFEAIFSTTEGLGIQIKALGRIKNPDEYSVSSEISSILNASQINQININRNKDKKALQFYLFALTCIFLLIECMPILSKLFLRPSLYESYLKTIVEKADKSQMKESEIIKINSKHEQEYTERLSKSARDELAKAQENIMKSLIAKWEQGEMREIEKDPKKYIK
jgi:hypothetical protein